MKKITPFKLLLFIVAVFSTAQTTRAQMLETVDMSTTTTGFNTYVTGLNNKGYITGYANQGNNIGFIITPNGRRLIVDPIALGVTDTKVESINDNEVPVAVVTANDGATVSIYRCYLDVANDTISHFVQVTGLTQPSSVAFDINNNNDISGWFQASTRFLWVKHDSIVPTGNIAYESNRVEIGIDVYNTLAGGINDANKVAGFYIDGTLIKPFIYDNLTENFTYLNSAFKIRLWDINNSDWVAGEYLQTTNNVYMGFIANSSTGSLTQFTSLNTIFDNNDIQSVANAINDNGEVAGSFYHPTLNRWVGFVYRPNVSEYRIPGFSFDDHTWKMKNSDAGTNPIFPSTYWQGVDYFTQDPYANNGTPLLDNNITTQYQINSFPPSLTPTWKGFGYEIDGAEWGLSSSTFGQNYYNNIAKPYFFGHYGQNADFDFGGYCYGFSYTTLLRYFDDPTFVDWFTMPANTDISQVNNTDNIAIRAIERTQLKQFDQPHLLKYYPQYYANTTLWEGLYRLKNTYRLPVNETNPRAVFIKLDYTNGDEGYHSILPYKIRTPRKLPFDYPTMKYDTMWVYDSNYPGDSSQHFTVRSIEYSIPCDSANDTSYGTDLTYLSFNEASLQDMQEVQNTVFKSTSGIEVSKHLEFSLMRNLYYQVNGSGLSQASLNNSGFTNDATDFLPIEAKSTGAILPHSFKLDTANAVTFTTYNYADDAMVWVQSNKSKSMGISREAQLNETDHGALMNRHISYGNPDNTTKYLNCYLNEFAGDQQQGATIMATGVCAEQGDSIVTENPSPYVYSIKKVSGSATCTYTLTVFAAYNGTTVNEFSAPVELSGTTTHTIDPYFVGLNGVQIAVIVDNGNDGITDDTLFVAGFPVGVENMIHEGGIKVYPNPVADELNVEFAAAGKYNITITDVVGRTLSNNTMSVSAGKTVLPMGQYPNGVYLIQVKDEKGSVLLKDKIIKQ